MKPTRSTKPSIRSKKWSKNDTRLAASAWNSRVVGHSGHREWEVVSRVLPDPTNVPVPTTMGAMSLADSALAGSSQPGVCRPSVFVGAIA